VTGPVNRSLHGHPMADGRFGKGCIHDEINDQCVVDSQDRPSLRAEFCSSCELGSQQCFQCVTFARVEGSVHMSMLAGIGAMRQPVSADIPGSLT
jgi:hypothetical protein